MAFRFWIDSIRFNSGQVVQLAPESIVVVVGPNNGGKSSLLRELLGRVGQRGASPGPTCVGVSVKHEGTKEEFEAWLNENLDLRHLPTSSEATYVGFNTALRKENLLSVWSHSEEAALISLHEATCCLADVASRLRIASAAPAIDFVGEAIQHPIHQLYKDDDAERRLSAGFRKAFGLDLVVNRAAGQNIPLVVGTAPKPGPGEDRVSMGYARQVRSLQQLDQQGDGMRSFVGALLSLVVPSRLLVLIDEPEAFLHPPQARLLGSMLPEWSTTRQLFIATHNGDLLRGLLDSGRPLHVLRIRRDGLVNPVAELDPSDVRKLWDDSILRFSNVLDGVFHERVLVCEGDADCRFYSALVDALVDPIENPTRPDLMFASSGGKHRMVTVITALVRLGVPCGVIVDIDILNAEQPLRSLFEAFGGSWSAIDADWKYLKSALEHRAPSLTTEQVRQQITSILTDVSSTTFPVDAGERIRNTLKQSSPWGRVKESGIAGIPSGQPTEVAKRLLESLRRHQIHVVDCGELERFVPTLGGHGPAWVSAVLDRDLRRDPELARARDFARSFLSVS